MKTLAVVLVFAILYGCGGAPPAPAPPAEPANQSPAAGALSLDQEAQQKARLAFATVTQKDSAERITAPGHLSVNEDRTWRVGAVASGGVVGLTPRVGDFVRAGQVLGHIHSHDVHEARAAYQHAISELERAKAAEAHARRLHDRAQRLYDLKAGSRQDVEIAQAEVRNAQSTIEKAQSEIERERAHLTDILRVPVDERHTSDISEDGVPILAPESGVVIERKATTGSVVNAGDELLSISDTGSLWMIAAANETDLAKLRAGQTVKVEVRAYPGREFSGRILKLGEQLDPATRTLQIRILVPNPGGRLKPEMYAVAGIEQGARRSILTVPEEAVQDISGVPAVFVRRSATEFEPRTVRTGVRANGEVEIAEGLSAGETVVVKGAFILKSQLMRRSLEEE
jgi:membrane fusion protein, heavy metal efflux system